MARGEFQCDRLSFQLLRLCVRLERDAELCRGYDGDGLTIDEFTDLRRESGNIAAVARRLRSLGRSIERGDGQRGAGPRTVKRLHRRAIF